MKPPQHRVFFNQMANKKVSQDETNKRHKNYSCEDLQSTVKFIANTEDE